MAITANLGYPAIGKFRELKKALEAYWKGSSTWDDLQVEASRLRKLHIEFQARSGLDLIPCGEFTLYDRLLDTAVTFGAVPERYNTVGTVGSPERYFAMARGRQQDGQDVTAMEMTKWFDTNYHYIVPELRAGQAFTLTDHPAVVQAFAEAAELVGAAKARPVLVGPVTFLALSKFREDEAKARYDGVEALAREYAKLLVLLREAGAERVQIDEPALALDLCAEAKAAFDKGYAVLAQVGLPIDLSVYFGPLGDNLETALALPVKSLHVDAVRGAKEVETLIDRFPADKILSLGVIDGRNIWKADLSKSLALAEKAVAKLGKDRVILAPSCSLLHVPADLASEAKLDADLKNLLAFALQKLDELQTLKRAVNDGRESVKAELTANKAAVDARASSFRIHNQAVKERVSALKADDSERAVKHADRKARQQALLNLPLLPTTTIGSLPQTEEVRAKRRAFKDGKISEAEYNAFLQEKTREAMKFQDEIGVDVPVHGEYERNDMVEYFGEQLQGFCFTEYGWVQSYGSRCVKPPIIFGDVHRPSPMTVYWSAFAQSCTERPVKGMLTGPVTILQWSFVRDDQPRETTCRQIALAIRDEVCDLEKAGVRIIQIDEPAFREGLPLRHAEQSAYLKWAGECFRISASGVAPETQIHTHMCYCEFNDIIDSIAGLDADVISIETSRSAMELLDAFRRFNYPNDIGPGVYDIHSPRVPKQEEMEKLLAKALQVLKADQIWVNPDCGLKTRGWKETAPALKNMVDAAKALRAKLQAEKAA